MGISFDNEQFVNLANFTAEQMKGYNIKTVLDLWCRNRCLC